jgi:RNA polymerase sigma-70 factor (ECF subfamily)
MDESERLFERFRRAGDTEALGRVFDATAPRLLQLAIHLVGDLAAAEDLLQATFVTAIERAATFDASRSLDAWLAGILANHARDLKKAARREIDVSALAERIEATPLDHALDAEWSAALAQAIERVPEPFRVVLILRLQHGMEPIEIAHALQRSPGAVRVQLHRGRELLRKHLPSGIVATALFLAEPGRGLTQVKANVVAHAAFAKSTLGVAAIVGGVAMSTKVAIGSLALVLALAALWFLREQTGARDESTAMASARTSGVIATERRDTEFAVAESATQSSREDITLTSGTDDADSIKLHGRVVDADTDQGIPGAEVELFAPLKMRVDDIRSRWPDRMCTAADGSMRGADWPRFATELSAEAILKLDEVGVYAPDETRAPTVRASTNSEGEFDLASPRSLGFLFCAAKGYASSHKCLTAIRGASSGASELTCEIAMRAPRRLFGFVVGDDLKRIQRTIRLRFMGRMRCGPSMTTNIDGSAIRSLEKDRQDPQLDSCVVETKADGSFECEMSAAFVYDTASLEPDLEYVTTGCLRENGTKLLNDLSTVAQPGLLKEPFVIVMRPQHSSADREHSSPVHAQVRRIVGPSTRILPRTARVHASHALELCPRRQLGPGGRADAVHVHGVGGRLLADHS